MDNPLLAVSTLDQRQKSNQRCDRKQNNPRLELTQGAKNSTRANFSPMTSFSNVPAVRSITSESAAATRLAKRVAPTGRIEVKRIVGGKHWRIDWFRERKDKKTEERINGAR
jgi:hypothetical protein